MGSQKQRHSLYSTFVFYTFLVFENMPARAVKQLGGDFIEFSGLVFPFLYAVCSIYSKIVLFQKSQLQFYYSMKLKIHLCRRKSVNYFFFSLFYEASNDGVTILKRLESLTLNISFVKRQMLFQ